MAEINTGCAGGLTGMIKDEIAGVESHISTVENALEGLRADLLGGLYKGEYDVNLKYDDGDIVSVDGTLYQSTIDNNPDTPPTVNWRLMSEVGVYVGDNSLPDAEMVAYGKVLVNLTNGRTYTKMSDGTLVYVGGAVSVDTEAELESLDGIYKVAMFDGEIYKFEGNSWVKKQSIATKKPMVSFVFDDAFTSHWDNAHLFEERGFRCGFAVNKAYTNISARMSTAQLKDLQARGFEILNHSFSHIAQTGSVWEQSQQEIEQNYELFNRAGLDITGFVTPSSQLYNKDRIEILKRHHSYAFTEYKGGAVGSDAIYSETDSSRTVFDLFRPECSNKNNTITTLDAIKEANGLTVFYSHNIGNTGAVSVEDLTYYLDYCRDNGIEIVTPRVLAKELARRKCQEYYEPKNVYSDKNIYSGHFGFSKPDDIDAAYVDDGDKRTITVTAGDIGELVCSNIYTSRIASALNQEFVFQLEASSSATKEDGLTIGIRVQKASDNSVLYYSESQPVKLDGHTRKYKISIGNITVDEEFYFNLFYRIKGAGDVNKTVTIDKPFLLQGSIADIITRQEEDEAEEIVTRDIVVVIDNTTIASGTRTSVNMVGQSNSLVTVEQDKITIAQSGTYAVNAKCRCTLDADHNGTRIISLFIVNGSYTRQSDKTAIADRANFDNVIIRYFDAGDIVEFNLWQGTGAEQIIGLDSGYNQIEIAKIS